MVTLSQEAYRVAEGLVRRSNETVIALILGVEEKRGGGTGSISLCHHPAWHRDTPMNHWA